MQTLAQNVTESLRDWILHGQLRPGSRLEELPLAEKLGVSRTPVRAALATLANEGLIDHQPKRGYMVRTSIWKRLPPPTKCALCSKDWPAGGLPKEV